MRSNHTTENNGQERMKSMKNTSVYMCVFVCAQIRKFIPWCFLSYLYALFACIGHFILYSLRFSSVHSVFMFGPFVICV